MDLFGRKRFVWTGMDMYRRYGLVQIDMDRDRFELTGMNLNGLVWIDMEQQVLAWVGKDWYR